MAALFWLRLVLSSPFSPQWRPSLRRSDFKATLKGKRGRKGGRKGSREGRRVGRERQEGGRERGTRKREKTSTPSFLHLPLHHVHFLGINGYPVGYSLLLKMCP